MVTLQEVKQYLRIDFEDDDPLLLSLIFTAKQLVMDVGRMDETQLAENEDVVRTAMLYTVSYLYENRNTADFSKLTLTLRAMLFAQREGVMYWKLEHSISELPFWRIVLLPMKSAITPLCGTKRFLVGQGQP